MHFDPILFDEDIIFTYIGYAAGLATILTFVIQIIKIFETKSVTNLSSYMYIIYTLSLICWAAYGVYIESWVLVIANLITFLFTFTILLMIIYYDAEDKIERARRDDITSVYNRKYFEETTTFKSIEAVAKHQDFSIIMLTALNYDDTIEQYGKKAGVALLKNLAKFLDKELRGNDMVARYAGNKFSLYLSGADEKAVKLVAERLYNNLQNTNFKISKHQEGSIQIAMGACTSKDTNNIEEMLNNADSALSKVTSRCKNSLKMYK